MLPYGKQTIEKDDVAAVLEALQSDWLTTGPKVAEFETAFAAATSTRHAVAVSSGTAALHAAMVAANIGSSNSKGEFRSNGAGNPKNGSFSNEGSIDEVIVPAITFAATSNAAIYCGAKPVFADVDPDTLLIDPTDVERKITPNTRAIVAMDYGGQPCDYAALRYLADKHNLILIADACHSLGASAGAQAVGSLADLTCFSLHPIKQITSGEGGMIVTNDGNAALAMKQFRNHGITTDHRQREKMSQHQYAMETLGFNYRLTDIQCALGLSQLSKLKRFVRRRNDVARFYGSMLSSVDHVTPLSNRPGIEHGYHLFVVRWNEAATGVSRDEAFDMLRDRGIGVNVHYQPVYQHPYYKQRFGEQDGCCPNAEAAYQQILSLPIFPSITETDIRQVVGELISIGQSKLQSPSQVQRKVA